MITISKRIIVSISMLMMLVCNLASAQLTELPKKCNYEQNDLTLTINGWDFDRTDYDHATFASVVGAAPLATLSYSGEKDTEEFGYPWFYYKETNHENDIRFSGLLEGANGIYNGKIVIDSFKISSRDHFNVNGLRVGDSKAAVISTFNVLCYDNSKSHIYLYYKWYTLTFIINTSTNLVSQINLYSPL